ncbi:MAG TPA: 2-oxoacid:acceptor oxidoreductase subunit alpha [Lacipirellulaceae bacterium]|jgi:2-oxoglutarate ferredoxin oxidoreductase subunit alpha|nr:2-oxoacid:acceptor oxidoreductase subunit alpha [Lacipirellulaceae bacterium]
MSTSAALEKEIHTLDEATVRFCGDSGDGMQLAGTQFTNTSALMGNDIATFPDFPAEIRAPQGTLAGVSGFQVHFSSTDIYTPGDTVDALVAMNPAALATNLGDLRTGGILIVNSDTFEAKGLDQAGYETNPLEDGTLKSYRLHKVAMTKLTRAAVEGLDMSQKEKDRCRNFFAMGLVFWLYDRPLEPTLRYIEDKFGKKPEIAQANTAALKAGYHYGETVEAINTQFHVPKAKLTPGKYTSIVGNTALAYGLMTAARLSNKRLFLGAYPITPASSILEELARHKNFDVLTFQAEDEIAAMTATIGAAFAGAMAVTASSGPGIALKGEGIGLAIMTELPMVVINVQRGGPSTGLPTKTEQADLFQAIFGRNGECPMPVIAACSPADCFDVAQEAWRIAVRYMVPVMLLTDGYIANGSEPWRIPKYADLKKIEITHPGPPSNGDHFLPYRRDERLARPWAIPGTPGLEHRIGGLEKQDITGNVSYDPANHQHMVDLRADKVARVANDIPPQKIDGPASGDLLVLSWGGTYGACATATHNVQAKGKAVSHCHLRWLNPLPKDLGDIMKRFKKVLIPELNLGQLRTIIRANYLIDAIGLNKVQGKPFSVAEVANKMEAILGGDTSSTEAKPEPIDLEAPAKAILEKVAHGG